MTRRVTEHHRLSLDKEILQVVTVYDEGINKQAVRRLSPFSKRHDVLVPWKDKYEWRNRA